MKLPVLLLLSSLFVSAETLSISEQQTLKTYNHKPSLKKTVERRMQKLAKVSKDEATEIASLYCAGEEINPKLTHKKRYLFYYVGTQSCQLYINALDGSLLSEEKVNG
ncbi:hypothetical protein [Sulfurovum mangrovi]|uniref:hypothetical protein n=1 Tax=Sulfurovum mangrovi TaxID=2893889 RepID=UPI001E4CC706|nr:hypothetical protein [Sulfurovum mangrovi]UFH59569.1 hypothetical protein LN246_01660 [Sulfurovum mangrovi]UFH60709.1 hypothetical protein LN246_14205 [Sulfurovum mangrovi]